MLTEADLSLCHFSLRYATLEERVESARSAGFAGIGVYGGRYEKWLARGWSSAGIASLIADHGLVVTELKAVQHWAGTPDERAEARRQEDVIYAMAEALGGSTINIVGNVTADTDEAAELLAAMCDRARENGLSRRHRMRRHHRRSRYRLRSGAHRARAGRSNAGLCSIRGISSRRRELE